MFLVFRYKLIIVCIEEHHGVAVLESAACHCGVGEFAVYFEHPAGVFAAVKGCEACAVRQSHGGYIAAAVSVCFICAAVFGKSLFKDVKSGCAFFEVVISNFAYNRFRVVHKRERNRYCFRLRSRK